MDNIQKVIKTILGTRLRHIKLNFIFLSEIFLVSPPLVFEEVVLSSAPVWLHTDLSHRHLLVLNTHSLSLVLMILLEVGQGDTIDVRHRGVDVDTGRK